MGNLGAFFSAAHNGTKESGNKKGKQLAKKVPPKRPAAPASESEDECNMNDHRAILEQLALLEHVQGLSLGSLAC